MTVLLIGIFAFLAGIIIYSGAVVYYAVKNRYGHHIK